ncbi:hypothetical protein NliqN6_6525 [Naganishia liquefaciens]|uniref:Uncharacterized protein n=1 Tax=Naganishia liquefaciens TaxID=104408 RepID=A0A8H3U0D5_9TREE|nr:hypothetical protein NliqN6_6525 [Naganishia liquefaciens]
MAISIITASRIASAILVIFSPSSSLLFPPMSRTRSEPLAYPPRATYTFAAFTAAYTIVTEIVAAIVRWKRPMPNLDERGRVPAHVDLLAGGFRLGDGLDLGWKVVLQ